MTESISVLLYIYIERAPHFPVNQRAAYDMITCVIMCGQSALSYPNRIFRAGLPDFNVCEKPWELIKKCSRKKNGTL